MSDIHTIRNENFHLSHFSHFTLFSYTLVIINGFLSRLNHFLPEVLLNLLTWAKVKRETKTYFIGPGIQKIQ